MNSQEFRACPNPGCGGKPDGDRRTTGLVHCKNHLCPLHFHPIPWAVWQSLHRSSDTAPLVDALEWIEGGIECEVYDARPGDGKCRDRGAFRKNEWCDKCLAFVALATHKDQRDKKPS